LKNSCLKAARKPCGFNKPGKKKGGLVSFGHANHSLNLSALIFNPSNHELAFGDNYEIF
jgi:hypothetical protein